ncbi:hypothetical protein AN3656.2 [Aspergillus nidulans FGSC A4]|nr:hypothetical protein AN3656.2 [Aspergillus nidulans FGSC A4]|eukprot:XP_661260.1 hypothetical protein AN3656.2 [Aspergillus nidulans FGSC A4]
MAIAALFLPEAADYIGSSPAETISLARPVQESEFVLGLQSEARDNNLHINVGIHEPAANGRVKNTLIWIDDKGYITQRYQKLRFPEISLALRRQNAQIITYPSAFTVPTGRAHWETLLRARAIETQSYVIAAAQAGPHNEKRQSYGHSMIVNPWGEIMAKLGDEYEEPQIVVANIDLELLGKVRTEMPLLRRTDIYPEI